jgi:hypothetical protein
MSVGKSVHQNARRGIKVTKFKLWLESDAADQTISNVLKIGTLAFIATIIVGSIHHF